MPWPPRQVGVPVADGTGSRYDSRKWHVRGLNDRFEQEKKRETGQLAQPRHPMCRYDDGGHHTLLPVGNRPLARFSDARNCCHHQRRAQNHQGTGHDVVPHQYTGSADRAVIRHDGSGELYDAWKGLIGKKQSNKTAFEEAIKGKDTASQLYSAALKKADAASSDVPASQQADPQKAKKEQEDIVDLPISARQAMDDYDSGTLFRRQGKDGLWYVVKPSKPQWSQNTEGRTAGSRQRW
eukprot:COSAG06_NODE_6678_length_2829_cov_7.901832_1_plen_238_part_00